MAEITAATAVGWVVSPVIKMVTDKIKTFIEEKYFQKSGIEDDMTKMNMTLLEILSTMAYVEKQRIVEPNQVQLVRQIKDAVYDAEDCMDEFDYELLKEESEKLQQNKVRCVSHVTHRAIVGNSNSKKKRVGEVSERLDQANRLAEKLLQLMKANISGNMQLPEQENQFLTSSLLSEEIIIGREKERDLIIEWILEEQAGPPTIIPIVGQGGLGKTTLAQMVFNDPRVKGHFDQTMWVTVSDNFDKLELTKQMLKDVCENFPQIDASYNNLQKKLEGEFESKKILLVFDDVWYVKDDIKKIRYEQDWSEVLAPFKKAKGGSKIIMTTRQDAIVSIWGPSRLVRPITLQGLNDDDSWSLFKLWVFDGSNQHNRKELEPIGKLIVKKLKGLPLAIRVMGPRLRGKSVIEDWERSLNDNSLELDNGIMEVLHRSYEHLPGHLQRCFAYCSLFPKDYNLKRDRLVHMWIAQGFVHPKEREILEDVGKSYFNELIARSFIQVIKRAGYKEYYVMHDLMNDLASHVSQGECYILKEGDTLENLGSIRHLSITPGAIHLIKDIRSFDKLRTLILLYTCSDDFSIKMKRIRVLDMESSLESLPHIGECKHLRYLCFRNCRSKLSPDAFGKLHLLTVLFITGDQELSLPQGICSMSRLKLIDTSKLIKMDLGGQVQLHSLWRGGSAFFKVQEKKGWKLGQLRDFNNIKGILSIHRLENVASREEAIEAQLDSKDHVNDLRLRWYNSTSVVKSNKHNEVLEALRPHPNIERLSIRGFPGNKWPCWLESNWLSRMTYIWIGGYSSGFKTLPALGHLSLLKKVEIEYTTTVSRIGDEFYGNGIFPSLEELQINCMEGLEEWSSPCGVQLFPKLRRLELYRCPELFSLPEMESFCSLELVQIVKCPKIKSLPKLPVSLGLLIIGLVHRDLQVQIRNKNGQEWDKVAAVSGCRCQIY